MLIKVSNVNKTLNSNLKTYVGNLFTWHKNDVVNKRNKGKWMISFHRILRSLWLN